MTPKEARELWIAALRSGDWEQGQGQLSTMEGEYCCLGVATELCMKELGSDKIMKEIKGGYVKYKDITTREGSTLFLLPIVQRWLGIDNIVGRLQDGGDLCAINDMGINFEEIASEIETQLIVLDS